MTAKVRYAFRARAFLSSEHAYLADRSEAAAERFRAQLAQAERRILDYPEIGTMARVPGFRRLVIAPYILIYRFRGGHLEIADIRHGRQRDMSEAAREELEDR